MIEIVGKDGKSIGESVAEILSKITQRIKATGKIIQSALLTTTQNHFRTIYPSSTHYSPDKVTKGSTTENSGEIIIDVAGISRAYNDLKITPKIKSRLTIPIHQSAYGKKASSFSNLFFIKKKNKKEFLAQKTGNGITFMYYLAKEVHQQRDPRLMPSNETYVDNIIARIKASLKI